MATTFRYTDTRWAIVHSSLWRESKWAGGCVGSTLPSADSQGAQAGHGSDSSKPAARARAAPTVGSNPAAPGARAAHRGRACFAYPAPPSCPGKAPPLGRPPPCPPEWRRTWLPQTGTPGGTSAHRRQPRDASMRAAQPPSALALTHKRGRSRVVRHDSSEAAAGPALLRTTTAMAMPCPALTWATASSSALRLRYLASPLANSARTDRCTSSDSTPCVLSTARWAGWCSCVRGGSKCASEYYHQMLGKAQRRKAVVALRRDACDWQSESAAHASSLGKCSPPLLSA